MHVHARRQLRTLISSMEVEHDEHLWIYAQVYFRETVLVRSSRSRTDRERLVRSLAKDKSDNNSLSMESNWT